MRCDLRTNITNDNAESGIQIACPNTGCIRFNNNSATGNTQHPFFLTNGSAPACQFELPTNNSGNIDTGSLSVEFVPAGTCAFVQ
jgi:hypothetical protein